jgi:hypothetical protein
MSSPISFEKVTIRQVTVVTVEGKVGNVSFSIVPFYHEVEISSFLSIPQKVGVVDSKE